MISFRDSEACFTEEIEVAPEDGAGESISLECGESIQAEGVEDR